MEKVLSKKAFPQWVKKLESYTIYSPRKDGDFWNYEVIKNSEIIDLDYLNTVLSPKKIIFPQREVLLEFGTSNEEELKVKEDYWKRRNSTTLVGLTCNAPPSPDCFCLSVDGSPHSKEGLDILMTDLGDKYYAESFTKKGDELLNLAKVLFKSPTAKDKKDLEKIKAESKKKIKRQIKDTAKIPPKLKDMFDSPFWDEESLSCIRCGICTYLCPTCHCFDMNDEVTSSSPIQGERVRTWDNCQFPDFTMHSSGHNPRPDKASRLRQRILHKFQYFVELYKNYQCTGCGRCISKCPVGIDIIEVLEKARDHGS